MPLLQASELRYDYEWKASSGDNPKLIEGDAHHLSRKEGYEMLRYLSGLSLSDDGQTIVYGKGRDITTEFRLYVEWMLKEYYRSTAPGRGAVTKWVNENWRQLRENLGSSNPSVETRLISLRSGL